MAKKNRPADYWRAKSDERRESKKPQVTGESGAVYDNEKIGGVDKLEPSDNCSYLSSSWQEDSEYDARRSKNDALG
ncbi:MAG TPA: hypothetical protein PLI71_09915 [Clostridia bacterium]|nr:hypothetical protein [Clostridia bacterium]